MEAETQSLSCSCHSWGDSSVYRESLGLMTCWQRYWVCTTSLAL